MVFPAPIKGLKLFGDIANVPDGGALVLDNWVVGSETVRPRNGSVERNTGLPENTTELIAYRNGAVSRLFAFSGIGSQSIYDISSFGPVGFSTVAGLAQVDWSFVQFATGGGEFLIACGKGNDRLIYDGASWSTSPAITGIEMNKLAQTWIHGKRLWFIEAGSLNAWYLPADSIGGEAVKFPLGGLFSKGGTLVAGSSWSYGTDGNGMQAMIVFVTSEGEIAVYQGTDPATDFSIKDVYRVAKPCGLNCFMKADGDLAIMTEDGLFAMSQIVTLDAAALANKSISRDIRPLWLDAVRSTDTSRWKIIRRDILGYAIVCIPAINGQAPFQFVANLQTGSWSRWTGWDAQAMATFGDELVFAGSDGKIYNGEVSGADNGAPFTAVYVGPFRGKKLRRMIARLARVATKSNVTYRGRVSALFDYNLVIPGPPQVAFDTKGAKWDEAEWDTTAKWSGGKIYVGRWQTVRGMGTAIAPCVQYTFGQSADIDMDLIRTDVMIEAGSIV